SRVVSFSQEPDDSLNTHNLQELVVTEQSARNRIANARLGSENLELTRLSLTPKMFGEADIIKQITLLPGVNSEAEGAGGFEVRGGNAYQNLVTMDGMTLYNPAHMMGIFSTFNEDAMSRAILHKGPVPASFGGASSSVLETYMKPGDLNRYHFSGTIGILNAKVSAEGPIVKDKLSFAVAARRSYVDAFLNIVPQYKGTVMNFFDVNAKLRYKINDGNLLDASFFAARDNLALSRLMEMRWGNIAGSINWSTRKGENWRFTTTAAATNYTTDMGMYILEADQTLTEYIRSFSLNERISYDISDNHTLEFGARSELLGVKSGDMMIRSFRQRESRSGWQNALWIGYDGEFSSVFSLSLGTRFSTFSALSGKHFHTFEAINEDSPDFSARTYFNVEPRGSIKVNINDCHNIKAGASITTQDLHGLRSSTTTFPFDRYSLTSAYVKPERATQYSLGYAGMVADGSWDWSTEGYYKSMRNVYDYKDGVTMFSRINLESLMLCGKGRSYGLELMLRKNSGKLNGWISYTLSKTETKIPGINGGRWYKASNDKRNNINVVAIYNITDKWNVSASWTYSSGRPLTAPDEKYEISGTTCYYYTERNSYRTPSSHRLDLSATYTRVGRKVTSIVSFGVYNAYMHYSPFVVYFQDDPSKPSGTRAVQRSLFGIVPSVSYTIKF
ncbi:MAG: TonB-dependent receptor plug domain-containing protein, partial [Muribaculaceae bacterium]|nr:TonB-dependent receptor plug domain-containing protein [Muribaculaceae bacterium]